MVGEVVARAERAVRAAAMPGKFKRDERGVVVDEVGRERSKAGGVIKPAVQGEDDVFAFAPALAGEADVGQIDADFAGGDGLGHGGVGLAKDFRMGIQAGQFEDIAADTVDQQQVVFDVAITKALPIAAEWVIFIFGGQGQPVLQAVHDFNVFGRDE